MENKILDLLQAKVEDDAIRKIKILATPPVVITIVASVDGAMEIQASSSASPDLVQSLLLDAAKAVLTKKPQHSHEPVPQNEKSPH